MLRATVEAVIAVLTPGKDYDTLRSPSLDPFIVAANGLVNFVVQNGARYRSIALDDSPGGMATQIETWLAAGLYKVSDPQWKSRNTSKSGGTARGDGNSKPSERNEYIIQACAMDYTNVLRPLMDGRIAVTGWLGKQIQDQIPYGQRPSI